MTQTSNPPPFGKPTPAGGESSVTTRLAIIEEKLQGGNRAFAQLRDNADSLSSELAVIKDRVSPKATNWIALIGTLFGILVTVIGAFWLLRSMFDERPTRDELRVDQVEQREAIEQLRTDYRSLRDQQIESRTLLNAVDKKLDQLLQRAAAKPAPARKPATPAP